MRQTYYTPNDSFNCPKIITGEIQLRKGNIMSTPKERTKTLAQGMIGILAILAAVIVARHMISDSFIDRFRYADTIVVLNVVITILAVILLPAGTAFFINLFRRFKQKEPTEVIDLEEGDIDIEEAQTETS